jgi:hypothetical protein
MKSRIAILAAALLLWVAPAFGQACAMCYSSAAGAPQEGQRALRRGVAVLIVPPVGFVTVGLGLAFRYSRKRDLEQR